MRCVWTPWLWRRDSGLPWSRGVPPGGTGRKNKSALELSTLLSPQLDAALYVRLEA